VGSFAVAPSAPGLVYLGTGYGLHRSVDGGLTWRPVRGRAPVAPLLVDSRDASLLFGQRHEGDAVRLVRSTDGGRHWQLADRGLVSPLEPGRPAFVVALAASSQGRRAPLFAAARGGLFLSHNRGAVWHPVPRFAGADVTALAVAPGSTRWWVGVGGSEEAPGDVFVSGDGGHRWSRTRWPGPAVERLYSPDPETVYGFAGGVVYVRRAGKAWRRLPLPADRHGLDLVASGAKLLLATDYGVFRSDDQGAHWDPPSVAPEAARPHDRVSRLADLTGSSGVVLASGLGGVWRWTDADGWRASTAGISTHSIEAVSAGPQGRLLASVGLQGIFASADRGTTWERRNTGIRILPGRFGGGGDFVIPTVALAPSEPLTAYALVCRQSGRCRVARSFDGGESWDESVAPRAPTTLQGRLFVDPQLPTTLWLIVIDYASGNSRWSLLRSDDAGASWEARLEDPLGIATVAIHPYEPDTVYAWTSRGLARTLDGGRNWATVGAGLGLISSSEDQALAIDPRDPRRLFVAAHDGVYVSADEGANFRPWSREGLPLPHIQGWQLLLDPRRADRLYLVLPQGLFVWYPERGRWEKLQPELPVELLDQLAIDPEGSALYAATADRGLFRYSLAD
jgi:photosystem II stability/assembly factor-like uncharacterized protein